MSVHDRLMVRRTPQVLDEREMAATTNSGMDAVFRTSPPRCCSSRALGSAGALGGAPASRLAANITREGLARHGEEEQGFGRQPP